MQLFSADAIVFSKKLKIKFGIKNMKKLPSKIAHNQPKFFSSTAKLPKTSTNLNL